MYEVVLRLFAALLTLHPLIPNRMRSCMMLNRESISQMASDGSLSTGVPPAVLLMVGFFESHLGCNPRSGGSWGSPVDNTHRHIAGTPRRAADDLATSYRVCGTWLGAVSRFRCGLCRCRPSLLRGYSPSYLMGQVQRVELTAGVELTNE